VQQVTEAQWRKMAKHPEVWRRADLKPLGSVPEILGFAKKLEPEELITGHITGVVDATGKIVELVQMPIAELLRLAVDMGIPTADLTVEQLAEAISKEPVQVAAHDANPDEPPAAAQAEGSTTLPTEQAPTAKATEEAPRVRGAGKGANAAKATAQAEGGNA
jgi:hypothetical protein